MNRAERRRNKKAADKDPVLSIRQSDLDRMWADRIGRLREDVRNELVLLLFSIPIKVMNERYGWGARKRLPELAQAILDEYDDYSNGDVTAEEYRNLVCEKCGFLFIKSEDLTGE